MNITAPAIRLFENEIDIDGFAGGGGASTGMEMALGVSPAIAINHDPIALAMHEANHPETRHIVSNIRRVRYECEVPAGSRIRVAWFSPDCTHHSKARGGKPFREPLKARRIRGLAWEAVRCAKALHAGTPPGEVSRAPRMIVLENVEEWRDWCPLLPDGTPDWSRRGANCRRWQREMATAGPGYVVEMRELIACDYGDPTKRKRLFIICRSDGQPIAWPEPTHGPGRPHPYRTAAECIDFSIPVPSIFLTQRQAYAWAKKHGLPKSAAPHRPLAKNSQRRIARGVFSYVLNEPNPFIINTRHTGHGDADLRMQSVHSPIVTIPASDREHALVAPVLINTRNGERAGQAPRVHDIREPFNTITALGSQGALVAAFLAKHNAGHEATGQRLQRPIDTVTTKDSKALVTSHLLKLRGGLADHVNTAQDLREPAPTATAGGTHYAEVRVTLVPKDSLDARYVDTAVKTCAFLVKYFGTGATSTILLPQIETVRVRTSSGLQGAQKLTKKAQTRLVGNSVPPNVAAALIRANLVDAPRVERAA